VDPTHESTQPMDNSGLMFFYEMPRWPKTVQARHRSGPGQILDPIAYVAYVIVFDDNRY